MNRTYALLWFLSLSISSWFVFTGTNPEVHGVVTNMDGIGVRARVGFQGEASRIATDAKGRFRLPANACSKKVVVHHAGYRIGFAFPSTTPMTLRLTPLPREDNVEYAWIDPHPDPAKANNCANCHGEIYREWKSSAHARSAANPKFLQLFAGTDGKSPVHETWIARAEHPDGAAVCATCHVPTLRSATLDYDAREAQGDAKSGIHCDYCHKVAGVTDKLGTRFGRDALELLRPAAGDAITYGPLDDAVRRGESFAYFPVYKESRYCASCHEGTVFGVHAYSTYSEWLASPAMKRGQQCQDCHMTPTGTMTNIAPGRGGVERSASTLASHHMPGGEAGKLRQALSMKATAKSEMHGTRVEIEIVAEHVGHRLPTGFVDRQVILVVQAMDDKQQRVELLQGAKLPPSVGKWSGWPGSLFAKQLSGEANRTPSPFWLPVLHIDDTRLIPELPERRSFVFDGGARRVTVQIWYRRFWQQVADARGWADNDLLVHEIQLDCK